MAIPVANAFIESNFVSECFSIFCLHEAKLTYCSIVAFSNNRLLQHVPTVIYDRCFELLVASTQPCVCASLCDNPLCVYRRARYCPSIYSSFLFFLPFPGAPITTASHTHVPLIFSLYAFAILT